VVDTLLFEIHYRSIGSFIVMAETRWIGCLEVVLAFLTSCCSGNSKHTYVHITGAVKVAWK
jgi:hypothetical protein